MKRVAMGLAFALAVSAFADQHAQTINKTSFVGVNKTQSAQSLGHSKLVFSALGDYAFGNKMFQAMPEQNVHHALERTLLSGQTQKAEVANYIGVNAYVGFAIGLLDYFDIGVTLPVYYDQFTGNTYANKEFIENAISYLVDGEGLIDIRSRELKIRLLDTTKIGRERVKWQLINTLVPIALIIGLGFVMAFIRKKKYSKK